MTTNASQQRGLIKCIHAEPSVRVIDKWREVARRAVNGNRLQAQAFLGQWVSRKRNSGAPVLMQRKHWLRNLERIRKRVKECVCACVRACARAQMCLALKRWCWWEWGRKKVTEHPSEVSITQVGVPDEGIHRSRKDWQFRGHAAIT